MKKLTFTAQDQTVLDIVSLILDKVTDLRIESVQTDDLEARPRKQMRDAEGRTATSVILHALSSGAKSRNMLRIAITDNGFAPSTLHSIVSRLIKNDAIAKLDNGDYRLKGVYHG